MALDEEEPQPGKVIIAQSVANATRMPKNVGAVYFVKLNPFIDFDEYFMYQGKKREGWWSVPDMFAYNEAYETWLQEVYPRPGRRDECGRGSGGGAGTRLEKT